MQKIPIEHFFGSLREKGISVSVDKNDHLDINAPKGILEQRLMEEIKDRKQELVDFLTKSSKEVGSEGTIPAAPEQDYYPLSSSQTRIWIGNEMWNDPSVYNFNSVTVIERFIDPEKLEQSIKSVVERHEILRTIFKENTDGAAMQWIIPSKELDFRLTYVDFRFHDDKYNEIWPFVNKNKKVPFSLQVAPLFRVALYRMEEEFYFLHYTLHHIISDGWSLNILTRDVFEFYEALMHRTPPQLEELRINYKDYAVWQQEQLVNGAFKTHRSYWMQQLQGELQVLNMVPANLRPKVQTSGSFILNTVIATELTNKLKEFCILYKGSLFMGLVTCVRALLYRYTGYSDLILGTPIAGRDLPELHNQIGLYINTLALRTPIQENDTFTELFLRVRTTVIEDFKYQAYPFDKLVEDIGLKRDSSRNALFDVMIGLQNFNENVNPASENVGIKDIVAEKGPSRIMYDLQFDFQEIGSQLDMNLEYNVDIYNKPSMFRMVEHFKRLLAACLELPGLPLKKIGYLTDQDRDRILKEYNNTAVPYLSHIAIPNLWSQWVLKSGDACAIACEGNKISYLELDQRTNRLAHYLIQAGVVVDSIVPVCLDRSIELVIAMLAVVKAGAAYVPIDPSYPGERISYILSDIDAGLVITHSYYSDLVEGDNYKLFYFDKDWTKVDQMPVDPPVSLAGPHQLAYIIYTSGSTGRPKGVMIEHTSVINLIAWHIEQYDVHAGSHSTAMAGVGFDAFALETWSALLSGSVLYIVPDSIKLQPDDLLNFYAAHQITHAFVPPALIPELIKASQPAGLCLKYVLIGGDRLPALDTSTLSYTLVNQYGPTESTVMVTDYSLPHEPGNKRLPPIGKPIANVRLYILDDQLSLVPEGIAGEIYIAGVQLARGYFRREELTRERFLTDPFYSGHRMYKTGDAGRWLEDGNIEYLGRTDEQVKIRGYRVEIGESENALQQIEDISSAAVFACRNGDDAQVLVGYFTSRIELPIRLVRQRLIEKLPEYMVPVYLLQIDKFPLTPNGKIDRNALPDPLTIDISNHIPYQPPRNELEQTLVEAYADVLKQERVGIKDNFFDLGGDSIKAILLVNRLKQKGYAAKVGDVLNCPVIEDLVNYIRPVSRVIAQHAVEGEIILLPIQRRFFEMDNRFLHHYNQSVLLHSRSSVVIPMLKQALDHLVIHHDALRMVFQKQNGEWRQFNQGTATNAYELDIHTLAGMEGEKEEMARLCDKLQESFKLESGPLVKVGLFKLSDGDQILIAIHHLVIDGISWRIILEDLSTLYEQLSHHTAPQLPLKSDSFQFWAQQLLQFSNSEVMKAQLQYWRNINNIRSDKLPLDFIKGNNLVKGLSSVAFTLDHNHTSLLQTGVNKVYGTEISDILIAALAVSLKDTFSISSILLQLEGHGREDIGLPANIERTVGWFTSVYPFLLDFTDAMDLTDFLVRTKDSLRLVPDKGIGYGLLRYLRENGLAALGERAVPQITFNYLGDFGSGVSSSSGKELFTYSDDYQGKDLSDQHEIDTSLTITAILASGLLHIRVSYGKEQFLEKTIKGLASNYEKSLLEILSVLKFEKRNYVTPGDLSYKGLQAKEWKTIMNEGDVQDVYEMSPLQEGIYYHWFAERNSTVYVEQTSFRVKGNLKVEVLHRSYDYMVERHDILRTEFSHEYGSKNLQIVRKHVKGDFRYRKKQGTEEANTFCMECRLADRKEGFNLGTGSQMRLTVLDLDNDEYELIWCHHHILMDGWCGAVLINEFYDIYESFLNGQPPLLEKVYPYANYIKWISGLDPAAGQRYWRNYFSGLTTLSPTPFKKHRKSNHYDVQVCSMQLGPDLIKSFRDTCRQLDITENTFMQAAWGYLLGRYTNTKDVVFGAVVSGRPAGELEGAEKMIGLFINTIPVRIRYEDHYSVKQLLQEAQGQSISALPYHYNRLSDIQSQSPYGKYLFDHVLIYENYPVEARPVGNADGGDGLERLQVLDAEVIDQTNYDFNIMIIPSDKAVHVIFRYNGFLFDEVSVQTIQTHYINVINSFSAAVDTSLSDLDTDFPTPTGITGRWTPDGQLKWLGNKENKMIVRGFVVWPEEIAARLGQLPGVNDVILITHIAEDGLEILVAYYTGIRSISVASMQEQLYGILPDHIIPEDFICLDEIPLTPDGEIDRGILTKQAVNRSQLLQAKAPGNDLEEKIASIWCEILKKDTVGVEDDFFRSGGNSLRILQILNQYHRAFNVKLSPESLFEHATIVGHASLIATFEKNSYKSIPKIPLGESYDLSDGQRRLWVLSQLESGSRAYNIHGNILLNGEYDPVIFEKAILAVIERHEILRTIFIQDDNGQLKQVVKPFSQNEFRLTFTEMEGSTDASIEAYFNTLPGHIFDLGKGPLLYAGLIRTGKKKYVFHYNLHHIISDGLSMEVLAREVLHFHDAYSRDIPASLPALHIQYKDYAAWQQDQLQHHLSAHRDYWLNQLAGELPILNLPTAGLRPAVLSNHGYIIATGFDDEWIERLESLCFANNATLFMGVLTILNILLYRYTGQSDLIIGNAVAGRDHADLEGQIGFYINMIALRTRISASDSFENQLRYTREITLEAFEHQSYPYDRLVEELQLKRDISRSPLFDVVINFKNAEQIAAFDQSAPIGTLSGKEIIEIGSSISKFDILFDFTRSFEGIDLHVEFNSDVYDKKMITRLLGHFRNLLRSITEDPWLPVSTIDYLSEEEKSIIIHQFNKTDSIYPTGKDIVSLFEQQVADHPDSIAVVYEDQELTYRELDERTTRLANYLHSKGIGRDKPVPLCVERSVEMMIGVLGILKSGGAYVPIDPSYPAERIRFIVADTRSPLVIGSSDTILPSMQFENAEIIYLDTDDTPFKQEPAFPIYPSCSPDQLAYLIYTSGSTGTPKGVMIGHRSVVNLVEAISMNVYRQFNRPSRMAMVASLSFDVSVQQIFGALLLGHAVYIVPEEVKKSGELLWEYYRRHQIDISDGTPTHLYLLSQAVPECKSPVQYFIIAGEALPAIVVRDFYNFMMPWTGNPLIINGYGPTEACVYSSIFSTLPGESHPGAIVPIGRPLMNTQAYILDASLQLQPIGVTGELYIGGVQLAKGYWNNPSLTDDRFIQHPFRSGEKMYRTGDKARWLPDGNIEYLGRTDEQVKVRGYRIEMGEIEHALLQVDGIHSAVATLADGPDGQLTLTGYVISDHIQTISSIRERLSKILPAYMIPSYFVQLESFPLTTNGKIDKKALALHNSFDLATGVSFEKAGNEKEKALVEVFRDVLHRENVSIKENFFDLGGDSIKAILLINKLKQKGYTVKVSDVLQYPVLEQLADRAFTVSTPIPQEPVTGEVLLTPIQKRFFEKKYSHKHHFNQSVFLTSTYRINIPVLEKCLELILFHHDALRMRFYREEGLWKQYNPGPNMQMAFLQVYDIQSHHQPMAEMSRFCDELQQSFQLETGPLFKIGLFRLTDGDKLLLIAHHLIMDGVSWRILLEDLSTLYEQQQSGMATSLPLKTDSMQYWTRQLMLFAQSDFLTAQLKYWQEVDHLRGKYLVPDMGCEETLYQDTIAAEFELEPEPTAILNGRAGKMINATVNEMLLAALAAAVRDTFGLPEVLLQLEGHGREEVTKDINISRTIGWFTTIYPFLLTSPPENDILHIVESVRRDIGLIPGKGIGYGVLKYLTEEAGFKRNEETRADITFNYLGDFGTGISLRDGSELFGFSNDYQGMELHGKYQMDSLLTIDCLQAKGALLVNIRYSILQFNSDTIERLCTSYKHYLLKLADILDDRGGASEMGPTPNPHYATMYKLSKNQLWYCRNSQVLHAYGILEFHLTDFHKERFVHIYREWLAAHDILRIRLLHKVEMLQQPLSMEMLETRVRFIWSESLNPEDPLMKDMEKEIKETAFDVLNGEMVRCVVIYNDKEALVYMLIHHIATDGVSNNLLRNQFIDLYEGKPALLKQGNNYLDFSDVQGKMLRSQEGYAKMNYWLRQLDGVLIREKGLPGSYTAPRSNISVSHRQLISGEKYEAIQDLCKRENILLSSFVISIFYIYLLEKLSKNEFIIDIVVDGRDAEIPGFEISNAIGQFVNHIPVALCRNEDDSFTDTIDYVQKKYLEGRLHQEIPFACLSDHYTEKYGISLHQFIDASVNFFDNTNIRVEAKDVPEYTRKNAAAEFASAGNISVIATAFSNGLVLDWEVYPDEQMLDTSTPATEELTAIIHTIVRYAHKAITEPETIKS